MKDEGRILELLAESLVRQDGLVEAVRHLADQLGDVRHHVGEQHTGLERLEGLLAQLHQRLDRVEHRQDRQEKILLHLLELLARDRGVRLDLQALLEPGPPPRALPTAPPPEAAPSA